MQNHIYYFIEHDQIYYLFFSWSTYYYFYIFIEPSLRNTTIWPFSPFIIIFSYILPPKNKTQKPYNNKTSILFIIVIFHFLQPIYHHPPFFFLVSPQKNNIFKIKLQTQFLLQPIKFFIHTYFIQSFFIFHISISSFCFWILIWSTSITTMRWYGW